MKSPPWHLTDEAFASLSRAVAARGPQGTSELDQLRATLREELDNLEVTLVDEWAVYHGLVWAGLFVELARNGVRNGYVDQQTFDSIAEIATTIGAALMQYAPERGPR